MNNILLSFLFLVISWASIYSQEKREDMDILLQKELGIEANSPKTEKPSESKETTETNEKNPILERYAQEEDDTSTVWLLLKIILVFGGLTLVMVYILKVMSRTRSSRYPVRDAISILSSVPIGTNKQIQIIEVANRMLVVGVGDSSVNLLTEITSIEDKARLLKQKENFIPTQENFLVTLLESLKDLAPSSIGKGHDSEEDKPYSSQEDEDLRELERRHKETVKRLRIENKNLGFNNET
jgi:flagellar protein FliO/FliZ